MTPSADPKNAAAGLIVKLINQAGVLGDGDDAFP